MISYCDRCIKKYEVPDEDIIPFSESYKACSMCGQVNISYELRRPSSDSSKDSEYFVKMMDALSDAALAPHKDNE